MENSTKIKSFLKINFLYSTIKSRSQFLFFKSKACLDSSRSIKNIQNRLFASFFKKPL